MAKQYTISVENAEIIFGNFSGQKKSPYDEEGRRHFSVIINNTNVVDALMDAGVKVKTLAPRDDAPAGEDPKYFVRVNLNMDSEKPPLVYMVRHPEENPELIPLTGNLVDKLDSVTITGADLELRLYYREETDKNGRVIKTSCTLWLKEGYFMVYESALRRKWEDKQAAAKENGEKITSYTDEDDGVPFN